MKILRISLHNIASLSGTHTVDFTRDPLHSAGLFSISGPTGAGKSTLLDALCLALFDATPRLRQVGRLTELASGERQNDPRMLLRRGAGEGFAEVAFVGVDNLSWTSRWSVRRSHKKSDGALQHVDMVLYQGHIQVGGHGIVAEGGKKTAVLVAISEKIGLTFEQFTRAVLLAQNDFATFLKADDKERAEILQALTGTEHFEAISKSVYVRAASEKNTIDRLESQLQGNAPLPAEDRAQAEAATVAAADVVHQLETHLRERESQVAWFRQRVRITDEQTKAQDAWNRAVEHRDASQPRRQELLLTEIVFRDARPLRRTELQAIDDFNLAVQSRAVANSRQESQAALSAEAEKNRSLAAAELAIVIQDQETNKPLLNQAREMDAMLVPLQAQFTKCSNAVSESMAALQIASDQLQTKVAQRAAFLDEQNSLQQEHTRLVMYVPFVGDLARWLDRIDRATAARTEAEKAGESLRKFTAQHQEHTKLLTNEQKLQSELQAACDAAAKRLEGSIAAENTLDAEQLAAERMTLETTQQVLGRLCSQLRELHSHRERASEVGDELSHLTIDQAADTAALLELRATSLPAASHAFETARSQLELIEAAVHDHAKKLRASLQDGRECPVCGSLEHPWSLHEPDVEATAVKAAKKSVREFEKRHLEVRNNVARLEAAVDNRSSMIAARQQELHRIESRIEEFRVESEDHPEIAAILTLAPENRLSSAEERARLIADELKAVGEKEKSHRLAARETESSRRTLESTRDRLQLLLRQLNELEKKQSVIHSEVLNAARFLEAAESHLADCMNQLSELWFGLPTAASEFERDARGFRSSFEGAIVECSRIEKRLGELSSKIQETVAAIEPLQSNHQTSQEHLERCQFELQSVLTTRDQHLSRRSLLFDGRSVDVVEAEFTQQFQSATKRLEESDRQRNETAKSLAMAQAELESAHRVLALADSKLEAARMAMCAWLTQINDRTGRQLTISELDECLTRDETWLTNERQALDQLDREVTSAEGAFRVYSRQLQEHLALPPTQEEEAAVLASLEILGQEVVAAKELADAARSVILNDDNRRRIDLSLTEQLQRQQSIADPWLRLNELLGSADGAKFRMIAQRRTLDILLRHANHQLNQLAGRYRLERLPESLNLVVIDRDMGDEERSVHSLSGGESFLVSLALALGLASLASNRLRIESLFIDEGFGSLDRETLDTAMNALMNLEAQGRKVGVISHVTEMTEAIPVQIKVQKGRGGASKIVIPGAGPEFSVEAVAAVSEVSDASGVNEKRVDDIASRILEILQREHQRGKDKVSSKSLREELGCEPKQFKSAQAQLTGRIVADGRSLRLVDS